MHHRNMQKLVYDIFEIKKKGAPEMLIDIFNHKGSNYSLRNSTIMQGRSIKIVMYGSETTSSLGLKKLGSKGIKKIRKLERK